MAELPEIPAGAPRGGGEERRIWIIAGVGAVLAAVFVVWMFSRVPVPPPVSMPVQPAPAVGLARLDRSASAEALREQAELLDPTPLFLPTHWNAQPRDLPEGAVRKPGAVFEDFKWQPVFAESAPALDFPAAIKMPAQPAEILGVGMLPRPLLGLGRVDLAAEPLAGRGGFIEVLAAAGGQTVLAQALEAAAPPAGVWAPLEFLVVVNAAGLVGSPQLARGSGNEAVDTYFRTFLVEHFRLGARLRTGFFRVCVGP